MTKNKRKLSAAQKAAKKKLRQETKIVFINGKMKRVRRPPTIEGLEVDDFIRANADPIFLHHEELWEYLEADDYAEPSHAQTSAVNQSDRELVDFISVETGDSGCDPTGKHRAG